MIIGSSYSGTAVTQRLRVQPFSLLPLEPSDRHACSTEAVRCAELHGEGQVWSNDWMCLGNVHGSNIRWLWRTQVNPRGRASCTLPHAAICKTADLNGIEHERMYMFECVVARAVAYSLHYHATPSSSCRLSPLLLLRTCHLLPPPLPAGMA